MNVSNCQSKLSKCSWRTRSRIWTIDTGASYSCVSMSLINRWCLRRFVVQAQNCKRLFTADGKPMNVRGTVELTVNINGLLIPFSFHVLQNLHHDMILGIDFLSSTESHIDTTFSHLQPARVVRSSPNFAC